MSASPHVNNGAMGRVVSVQGPVVDVKFPSARDVPNVFDVIETETATHQPIVLEVAEHLPGNLARCISLTSTLNLQRNATARPTGGAVNIPVGRELYGRIINVIGQPIDGNGPIAASETRPIRRPLPGAKIQQRARVEAPELLETGVKVIDMLFPLVKGSKKIGRASCRERVCQYV